MKPQPHSIRVTTTIHIHAIAIQATVNSINAKGHELTTPSKPNSACFQQTIGYVAEKTTNLAAHSCHVEAWPSQVTRCCRSLP
jgi:hypothetical protein